ncbi:MAG: AAA family ATPase, partial [Spirochaetales bacterium]|nr:AAA family ATPase [Spirochaetales bacterium]
MSDTFTRVQPLSFDEASFSFDEATIARCKQMGSSELVVGQPRALRSLEMGLSIPKSGYNIFVSGDSGSGRHKAVQHAIEALNESDLELKDIAYVHNYGQPDSPMILILN